MDNLTFLEACANGALRVVIDLIASGRADINFQHPINKWTGLHWAAKRNHIDIVDYLLRAGADRSATSSSNQSPLDVATNETIRKLLNPNDSGIPRNQNETFVPNYIQHPVLSKELFDYTNATAHVPMISDGKSDLLASPLPKQHDRQILVYKGSKDTLIGAVFIPVSVPLLELAQKITDELLEEGEEVNKMKRLDIASGQDIPISPKQLAMPVEQILRSTSDAVIIE